MILIYRIGFSLSCGAEARFSCHRKRSVSKAIFQLTPKRDFR